MTRVCPSRPPSPSPWRGEGGGGGEAVSASVFVVLTLLISAPALSAPLTAPTPAVRAGMLAPDFRLPDEQGKLRGPADFRGKVVLIHFFASWCQFSAAEIPLLTKLHRQHAARGLVILGVALDQGGWETLSTHVAKKGIPYLVVRDERLAAVKRYGVENTPTNLLVGRDGKVVLVRIGRDDEAALEKAVSAAVKRGPPAKRPA